MAKIRSYWEENDRRERENPYVRPAMRLTAEYIKELNDLHERRMKELESYPD